MINDGLSRFEMGLDIHGGGRQKSKIWERSVSQAMYSAYEKATNISKMASPEMPCDV